MRVSTINVLRSHKRFPSFRIGNILVYLIYSYVINTVINIEPCTQKSIIIIMVSWFNMWKVRINTTVHQHKHLNQGWFTLHCVVSCRVFNDRVPSFRAFSIFVPKCNTNNTEILINYITFLHIY